ncbi:hypothetical protein GCM10007918_38030 [Piscinibacter gummiphilus]|nr:hypothetical protein GCM10007918_38030 [Piscinibacter gummiphilus]
MGGEGRTGEAGPGELEEVSARGRRGGVLDLGHGVIPVWMGEGIETGDGWRTMETRRVPQAAEWFRRVGAQRTSDRWRWAQRRP